MRTLNSVLVDGCRTRYDAVSHILHWLPLLPLAQLALAWLMLDANSVKRSQGLIAWYVGVGTLLQVAVVVRLLWAERYVVGQQTLNSLLRSASLRKPSAGSCMRCFLSINASDLQTLGDSRIRRRRACPFRWALLQGV